VQTNIHLIDIQKLSSIMALTDFDLVLFGGGGDLSMRKLIPALYARDRAGDLPPASQKSFA
jgi:glucose-6-phosphate 1-dehydrogenase